MYPSVHTMYVCTVCVYPRSQAFGTKLVYICTLCIMKCLYVYIHHVKVREGVLEGYSSCQIELIFSPQTAVTSSQLFTLHFSRPGVPPVRNKLHVHAVLHTELHVHALLCLVVCMTLLVSSFLPSASLINIHVYVGWTAVKFESSNSPLTILIKFEIPTLLPFPSFLTHSQITISAKGEGLDLPVYVERDSIDLKICTIDRLYQDSIEIHNSGPTALRVSFNFPPELAPHMEILPRHGLVQGSSSFSAQLKFLPCPGIFTDCAKFFDGPENDCLTVPTEVAVVDQVYSIVCKFDFLPPPSLSVTSLDSHYRFGQLSSQSGPGLHNRTFTSAVRTSTSGTARSTNRP